MAEGRTQAGTHFLPSLPSRRLSGSQEETGEPGRRTAVSDLFHKAPCRYRAMLIHPNESDQKSVRGM